MHGLLLYAIYRLWLQFRLRACKQTPKQNYTQNQNVGSFVKLIYTNLALISTDTTLEIRTEKLSTSINFRTHSKEQIKLLPDTVLEAMDET